MTPNPSRTMCCLILLVVLRAPVPVFAQGFACAAPSGSSTADGAGDAEEFRVAIRKGTQSATEMQAWLKLLVGRYSVKGYVDLCGNGISQDQRPVSGKASCIASGSTPNVHCAVNVRWPVESGAKGAPVLGGVSNLAPGELVFSIERPIYPSFPVFKGVGVNGWGLVLLQLDNKGIPEWNSGVLVGNAFVARESCVGIPGDCHKITRVTINPDNDISMVVDLHVDRRRVLRQSFQFYREQGIQKDERSAGSPP